MLNERCRWMQTAANVMGLWFSRTGWRLERIVQRLSTVLISVVLLSACDGAGRPPTAPSVVVPLVIASPPVTATPGVTYTLSGTIFEVTSTGRTPLRAPGSTAMAAGAPSVTPVERTPTQTVSTASPGRRTDRSPFVGKDGYDVVGNPQQPIVAQVNGDTRFDIEFVRR